MRWFPILAYHRIVERVPADDYLDICTSWDKFERQMRYFARAGYRTLTLEEAGALLAYNRPIPPKHFAITFDDGYEDVFSQAVPILRRFGFTATIFIVTGFVGQTNVWEEGKGSQAPLMGWNPIRELLRMGFCVGSHTVSHPDLSQLSDDLAWHEVSQSRTTLESMLDAPIRTFCYPYGKWTEVTRGLVRKAGYDLACNDIWRGEHEQYALARINTRYYLTPRLTALRCRKSYFTVRSFVQRQTYPRVLPPSMPRYVSWKLRQVRTTTRERKCEAQDVTIR
jgi:peptidoglycan/xylan/chitin deacetylase (PgdA/CDA1 family)